MSNTQEPRTTDEQQPEYSQPAQEDQFARFKDAAGKEALSAAEKGLEAARNALEAAERKLAEAQAWAKDRQDPYQQSGQQPGQPQPSQPYQQPGQPSQPYQQPGQPGQPAQPDQSYQGQPYQQQPQPGQYYQQQGYQPPVQPHYVAPYASPKDHVAAGLLAILLGAFGIHKFYLGYNTQGFIFLAITILAGVFTIGIASAVMWVIAVVEGIIYLSKSQSEFERTYVYGKREWF